LWLVFHASDFGRAQEVQRLIEPWATNRDILTANLGHEFAIALDIPAGEEKVGVVRSLVDDIKAIAGVLDALPPQPVASAEQESDDGIPA
jgi:hypothetical protein